MAKENPAIKPRPKLTFGQWALALLFAAILLFGLHLTGVVSIPFFNNFNFQGGSSTTTNNNAASTDDAPATPSIKIESATATLLRVEEFSSTVTHICTVKMSGTIAGPPCSFLSFSQGRLPDGRPGLELYPFKCPSWRYWGTSPICSRDPDAPTSTAWSITTEARFWDSEGYSEEFIAILDTAEQPVLDPFGKVDYRCTNAELDQQITDSVFLTCG